MMIKIIRIPVSVLLFLLLTYVVFLSFIVETITLIFWYIILVIFTDKKTIENSWVSHYPSTLRPFCEYVSVLSSWAMNEDNEQISVEIKNSIKEKPYILHYFYKAGIVIGTMILINIAGFSWEKIKWQLFQL